MSTGMVDWGLAVSLGTRLAGEGPQISRADADTVVAELRAGASRSTGLVRDFTGLDTAAGTAPVLVVDRSGWIAANADAFSTVLAPVVEKLTSKKGAPTGWSLAVGSRVTGAEAGALLGFLAGKVLGQFDPFHPPAGRLLLVAPNVVHVERELGVDPQDFRLWVCLHEETHRVQFTATPWLADHLLGEMHALAETLEPSGFLEDGLGRIVDAIRGGASLIDLVGGPEQKAIVDRVTGVMSLLEGHADVVMDGVGPRVIPSVREIRAKFNKRRKGAGSFDRVLRRVLGLDAKMAQYRDGAKFVRAVVDKAGMAEFNAVWDRPENLPSKAEIADPPAWINRVL
jgi:coenzyme F420 biosynthesis associated uncharacterized protein